MKKPLMILTLALLLVFPSHNLCGQELPRGKKVSVNGMEMYHEIHGQGEPLVLMHGFFATGQMWEPFIEEFSQHFLLIIPDLRGHGRSSNPNPAEIYSTRQAAQDVFSMLDHLEITHFKAIGVSLGALILLHMSTQHPERVDAQVVIGGPIISLTNVEKN
jgi:pimeloyl-ACP methyl ester carboxylesterase